MLIPEPCFVAYESLVTLTGAKPVPIQTVAAKGFKASAADFEAALTDKTKRCFYVRRQIRQVLSIRKKSLNPSLLSLKNTT